MVVWEAAALMGHITHHHYRFRRSGQRCISKVHILLLIEILGKQYNLLLS